jgi:hypothetical protein
MPNGYPPGYHPYHRGHYPIGAAAKEETDEKGEAKENVQNKASAEIKPPANGKEDTKESTTLVFKTPTKTATMPKPPMKAPTKPSSEKESVCEQAAKAAAEKKARAQGVVIMAKENVQPAQDAITAPNGASATAGKPVHMHPTMPYHPYPYPGYMPPHMAHPMAHHPYPHQYAMPNVQAKRPAKKGKAPMTQAPQVKVGSVPAPPVAQAPPQNGKITVQPNSAAAPKNTAAAPPVVAAPNVAIAPKDLSGARVYMGPPTFNGASREFGPPSSGKKGGIKWCIEEVRFGTRYFFLVLSHAVCFI